VVSRVLAALLSCGGRSLNLFGSVVDTLGGVLSTLVSVLDTLGIVLDTLGIVLDTLGIVFNTLGLPLVVSRVLASSPAEVAPGERVFFLDKVALHLPS